VKEVGRKGKEEEGKGKGRGEGKGGEGRRKIGQGTKKICKLRITSD
jgi:hypothetical protein